MDTNKATNPRLKSLTRRRFLTGTGVAVGTVLLAPHAQGRSAASAPKSGHSLFTQEAQAGGELTFALAAEPTNLDSHMAGEVPAHNVIRNVCESLLVRDDQLQLAPNLAEAWSAVDELTYEFRLRQGVTFHNGEPFNADVVKWNYDRILNPDQNSRGRASISLVTQVEVIDDYTVHIKTSAPFPVLFARNTYAGTGSVVMLPPRYVQEQGDELAAQNPVGTGPFTFVEWQRGDRLTIEANADYWGGRPNIDQVTFRFIPETATRIAALLSGEVDVIESVPPDQVERIESSGQATVAETSTGMIVSYYQFNTVTDSPIKDVKVRQAINHAIDMESIVEAILGGHGQQRPIPLDPNDFGLNPDLQPYAYDPEKATALLTEAGYADGFSFTMHTSNGRYMQDKAVSETIAADLAEIGITVDVQPQEWGVYLDMLAQKTAGPMAIIGWGSGLFDADVLVDEFQSEATYASFADPNIDELLLQARTEGDEAKRIEYFHEAQRLLVEQAAFAAAYQANAIFGIGPRANWQPSIGELIFLKNAAVNA